MNMELNKTLDKKSIEFKRAYHNRYYAEKLRNSPPHFCETCKKNVHFMGIARHKKSKHHINCLNPEYVKAQEELKQKKEQRILKKLNHYKELAKSIKTQE